MMMSRVRGNSEREITREDGTKTERNDSEGLERGKR